MCYPVCGMVDIKEPMLLIGKSSPSGSRGFLLLLSKCPTLYNKIKLCSMFHLNIFFLALINRNLV